MFKNYGMNIANIFKKAEEERMELKHPYVGTEHLLLAILANDQELSEFFKKFNLTYELFKKELVMIVGSAHKETKVNLYTPMLKRVINEAITTAKESNRGVLTVKHLVVSLLEEGEGIAIRLLVGMGIDIDRIYEKLSNSKINSNKKLELLETGVLLNNCIEMDECVLGRDKEIDLVIETLLRKKKNNPILIGEAGVGKTAIVEELVRRIEKKEVPEDLYGTQVVSLEMGSLVSGTKYRGEFEEKLTKIIKELESNEKIILFIDEIHCMINAGGAEGAITAGDIFKPALARGKIHVIGATTNYEYNKYFSSDKALMRRFEIVNVSEPTKNETKDILLKIKPEYEKHHNVIISDEVIDKIIMYTEKFISNKKNPDKAIDFLDSVCSKVKSANNYNVRKKELYKKLERIRINKEKSVKISDYDQALKLYDEELKINNELSKTNIKKNLIVKIDDCIEVLENKTNMIFTAEKMSVFDNIERIVNEKLYNVDKQVRSIVEAMKTNLINKEGMLKLYLEGEANLGKSTLVKLIAENIPKCNFIRIDLNEYKTSSDVNKLIGSQKGYVGYNDEHLFTKLKNNIFSVILFDNYNVAHDNIKDLIKEILKEGYLTDNTGEKIYFNNSFIFITNDIVNNNKVGFDNELIDGNDFELSDLVDQVIRFDKLNLESLNKYLDSLNIYDKENIIKNSNYERYNYKYIDKLIKSNRYVNS